MPVSWPCLLLTAAVVLAEPEKQADATKEGPSIDFIEYLGRYETSSGKRIDPEDTVQEKTPRQKTEPDNAKQKQ